MSVPPTPAEGLKQARRVGVAVGARLDDSDLRLPVALFGVQQRYLADRAQLILLFGKIESDGGGLIGLHGRLQRGGICLQRAQSVRDVLAGRDDGEAILRRCLVQGGIRCTLSMQQRSAVKQNLGQRGPGLPETGVGTEETVQLEGRRSYVGGKGELR